MHESRTVPARPPARIVHCTDALAWLDEQPVLAGCSLFTSLPDKTELPGLDHQAWRAWFVKAGRLVVARTPPEGVTLFYQSDVKFQGTWVDKAYLVQRAAEEEGAALLFHKIICRKPPGTISAGRAGYGHLLCFSRGLRANPAHSSPDVLADAGAMTWVRAVGLEACKLACRFVLEETETRTVVDPFCGMGTALAVANAMEMDAIGVELNQKRARKARTLTLDP